MVILALETALGACSAAVLDGEAVRAHAFEHLGRGHAERLMPMIGEVMAAAGLGYDAVDALAVSVGPGTFTGVRIGLAAARGLALALDRPLIGVSTLEAVATAALLADPALAAEPALTIIHDARRGEVYMQSFVPDVGGAGFPRCRPLDQALALPYAAVAAHIPPVARAVFGTGVALVREPLMALGRSLDLADDPAQADAAVIARMAAALLADGGAPGPVRPLYLRSPDAKLPGGLTLAAAQSL